MLGECRFDPATGAPLSDSKSYPPGERHWVGVRSPKKHPDAAWIANRDEALTNGELQSSDQGLLGYFRRIHRTVREDPDPSLDRAAALGIKRLKAVREHSIDAYVWLALGEYLSRRGFWVSWMLDHYVPRCPHCHSTVKFKQGVDPIAYCASDGGHGDIDDQIRSQVIDLYNAAVQDTDDLDVIRDLEII